MLIDVVIGGPVGKQTSVEAVQKSLQSALGSSPYELSIPDLKISIPAGSPRERHDSLGIGAAVNTSTYIIVSASQSDDLRALIKQCKELLSDLTSGGGLSSLDRIWLKMNGQRLFISPEAPDETFVRTYLQMVYDDRSKMLRPASSDTTLEDHVFTAASVGKLYEGVPVKFSWGDRSYTLSRGKTPQELIGEISCGSGADTLKPTEAV